MFYAHFVLSKKGPLARIWLAAHWDKKLTKAHVFETNIDNSVEAILQPKVKLALRTSGHLMLGVVRIYSRKAKYLLADCNEAFVKIKMAFRPGVVDLPEENREAAVAAITMQENFHDFDTTLAELNDIDVQAQFSVNQSRPEDITIREDIGNINLIGDDGFGDVAFDDREFERADPLQLGDHSMSLYKSPARPDMSSINLTDVSEKKAPHPALDDSLEKPTDVDINAPITTDDFGGEDGFVGGGDDDDSDHGDDGFGGGVDQDFFGDNFMDAGGLFDEPPVGDVSMPAEIQPAPAAIPQEEAHKEPVTPHHATEPSIAGQSVVSAASEQTTLVHNEEEAFALEPIDVTSVAGTEKKGKRKRKLIVDEQKGIPSETMKMQLSDTSDIMSTLDLAPPTKKLMHWKETGGVEKLFALPARRISSKFTCKLFTSNLRTKQTTDDEVHVDESRPEPEPEPEPELPRHEEQPPQPHIDESMAQQPDDSHLERSTRSTRSSLAALEQTRLSEQASNLPDLSNNIDNIIEMPADPTLPVEMPKSPAADSRYLDEDVPSVAPFSVGPNSVGPPSVGPASVGPPVFEDLEEELENVMPENAEQEENRVTKRSLLMQQALQRAFAFNDSLSFKDITRGLVRKQVTSKFYTLLVLKKLEALNLEQEEEFGDIYLSKGPKFGLVS